MFIFDIDFRFSSSFIKNEKTSSVVIKVKMKMIKQKT
jgi:hypothetical protein